jgi:hypothetical protein
MISGQPSWTAVLPDLQKHVIEQVDQLLPQGLALLSTGPQIVLTTTGTGPRVFASTTPGAPAEVDRAGLADVAARLLDDAQDLVVTHLAQPWPLTETGRTTHPTAELVGTRLRIGFATRAGTDAIVLEPYPVPEEPPEVVAAG